jgi:hypothetical protein
MDPSIAVRVGRKSVSSRSSLRLNETASSFLGGRFSVLEPCDAKVSCTVLRGLGDRKVARLLGASQCRSISGLILTACFLAVYASLRVAKLLKTIV